MIDDVQNKTFCAQNLKAIAQAMINYSNTNNGKYPRVVFNYKHPEKLVAYSKGKSADPFAKDNALENDVTAGLYLLVRVEQLDPKFFICPATNAQSIKFGKGAGAIAESPTDIPNFPSAENLSYSGNCPYPGNHALATQWVWDSTLDGGMPLICDMNPGTESVIDINAKSTPEQLARANSLNHGGKGQNVLYGDYHVEFKNTPLCGPKQDDESIDNIFTRHMIDKSDREHPAQLKGDAIFAPPTDSADAVMLPSANYKPTAGKRK